MKRVPFTKEQIEAIALEYPTPFHIYDERAIRENARELIKAFEWAPGYKEYFAVKALPNPAICKIFAEEGCGLDCSSMTELMTAKAIGVTGDGIMFSSNVTPAAEYEFARSLDATINLDDISHIDFLERHGGIPELISCRYNPGGDFVAGNAVMGSPGAAKYGFTRPQLTEGYKKLMALGAKRFGLHAFLASNCLDEAYYPALARSLFETAAELMDETGANVTFINLSGGIGIPYRPEDAKQDIFRISKAIERNYDEVFWPLGVKPKIFMELGRYMTGPYGYLVSRALHQKHTHKEYVGLDACAANLMRPAIYGAYHHITVLGKENAPCDHMYDVTGSLCENNDKFAIDRMLPEIEIGDLLVIHDTGAHGHAMGYNYNGRLRSAELLLKDDGSVRLIRRAETPKDYFATTDLLGLNELI